MKIRSNIHKILEGINMSNEITGAPADSSLPNSQVSPTLSRDPNENAESTEPNAETLATENDELKAQIAAVEEKQASDAAAIVAAAPATPLAAENVALKTRLAELQNAPSNVSTNPTPDASVVTVPEQHPSEALPTPVVNEPGLQPAGEGLPEA